MKIPKKTPLDFLDRSVKEFESKNKDENGKE